MTKKIILPLLAILFAFVSCKKEDNTDSLMHALPPISIRSFPDIDALNVEVAKTLAFTYDDLVTYENSINFNSYGKLAEQAMMPILAKVETYIEEGDIPQTRATELQNILNANSQFLQLINDDGEDYCETRYYRSSFRYIMNSQCVFKVDTFYYKVFEAGHVYCGASNYSSLLNMSESEFLTLQDNDVFTVYKYFNQKKGNYGMSIEQTAKYGLNVVKALIEWNQLSKNTVGNNDVYYGTWDITVSGYIKFIWNWPNKAPIGITITTSKFNEYNFVNNGSSINTSGLIAKKLSKQIRIATVTVPKGVKPNLYIHTILGYCNSSIASLDFNLN